MSVHSSADKRHVQSLVRRMRNSRVKSQVHTSGRKFLEAIKAKDQATAAECLKNLQAEIDAAKSKGVVKANAASRKKSRMYKLFNKTFTAKAE